MRCLCENCYKYKFWFEMVNFTSICKKCAEELHTKIDLKIRRAFSI